MNCLVPSPFLLFKRTLRAKCPNWGLVSYPATVAYGSLPSWPKDELSPHLQYRPSGASQLKDPKEKQYTYQGSRWLGPPVFKPLPLKMTACPPLAAPRPRGLAVELTCFLGEHRTYRGCQSLSSARPLGGYECPLVPGLRVQLRGATAPGGYRHDHSRGTDVSC